MMEKSQENSHLTEDYDLKFVISKDVINRQNQDGTVILMKMDESNLFYKIDGIAAKVWQSAQSETSVRDLIRKFSSEYPSHADQIAVDIPNFVKELAKKSLILSV